MTKDNNLLGKFELTGIPPAPRGTPQIEVSFEIDVNGILKVSAQDKGTGRKESVTIKGDNGRLTQEEIARMIAEAEKFADEDKEARERIEARNSLENYAFSLKNQIDNGEGLGGNLDEDEKETVGDIPRGVGMGCDAKQSDRSSEMPSGQRPSGSTSTGRRRRPRILLSRERSCPMWFIPSPASSMLAPTRERRATTSLAISTMSSDLEC
jgi:heat shock protein 5